MGLAHFVGRYNCAPDIDRYSGFRVSPLSGIGIPVNSNGILVVFHKTPESIAVLDTLTVLLSRSPQLTLQVPDHIHRRRRRRLLRTGNRLLLLFRRCLQLCNVLLKRRGQAGYFRLSRYFAAAAAYCFWFCSCSPSARRFFARAVFAGHLLLLLRRCLQLCNVLLKPWVRLVLQTLTVLRRCCRILLLVLQLFSFGTQVLRLRRIRRHLLLLLRRCLQLCNVLLKPWVRLVLQALAVLRRCCRILLLVLQLFSLGTQVLRLAPYSQTPAVVLYGCFKYLYPFGILGFCSIALLPVFLKRARKIFLLLKFISVFMSC